MSRPETGLRCLRNFSESLSFSRAFSTGFLPDRDYRALDLSSNTMFTSRWGATSALLAWGDRPFGAAQFYGNYPSWERTRTQYGSVRQVFSERMQIAAAFRRHTDLFDLVRSNPLLYENRHEDKRWDAAVRRAEPLSRNAKLFWGVEGDRESIDSTALGDHQRSRGAVYASFDDRAFRRFSFSLGAREEVYSAHGAEFSPSASAGYWFTHRLKAHAAASRAFRLPDYTDLYYRDPANVGNPNLRPETAWTLESGIDWTSGGRIRAGATVFQNRVRNGIDYVQFPGSAVWNAANIQRLNLTGCGGFHFHQAAAQSNAQAQLCRDSRRAGAAGRAKLALPVQLPLAERRGHVGRRARRAASWRERASACCSATGQSSYALWDASAAYTRARLHPYLQLSDIAGTSYQQIQGIVMPGRAYIAGMELALR